jgi:hypothetical protein
VKCFVIDEAVDVVTGGVSVGGSSSVFGYSAEYVVGEAYVEIVRAACHNVDVKMVLARRHCGRISKGKNNRNRRFLRSAAE